MSICCLCNSESSIYAKNKCKKCYAKEYKLKNKGMITLQCLNYYQNNKEKITLQHLNYYQNNYIKYHVLRCNNNDKAKNFKNNLTIDWVNETLKNQNKQCFYCSIFITDYNGYKKLSQLSIDRKNNKIGHIQDNCVISCLFCNLGKNANQIQYFTDFIIALKNGIDIHKYDNVKNDIYWSSQLKHLLDKTCKKENIENQFTTEMIKEMYNRQNGLDFYTKLPMICKKIGYFPFKASIDRIDNTKPHTLDNCVLVCLSSNFGRSNFSVEEYLQHINLIRDKITS